MPILASVDRCIDWSVGAALGFGYRQGVHGGRVVHASPYRRPPSWRQIPPRSAGDFELTI
jgi:hypothetical protein